MAANTPDIFNKYQVVDDTQLHDLIKRKFPDTLMVEKQRQVVALLAQKLYDPNGRIAEGITPLHLAVQVNKFMFELSINLSYSSDVQYYRYINYHDIIFHIVIMI